MKYRKYILIASVTTFLVGATSCKKYLDKLPLDTITTEAFYSDATQVNQALTGV